MKRIFILALDGTPFTFLKKAVDRGLMPNFAALVKQSDFRQMDSVLPPVSSAAWASFMTGKFPSRHGIFGFVDRTPETLEWFVPLSNHLQGQTLWEYLSQHGKRVFVMNVPLTYPPRKVNGISICGFLGSDILKGTYPPEIGKILKARGYQIDVDTEAAKRDLISFIRQLHSVLDKRIETMRHFWRQEKWDFFMTHIMETDRLHHFLWEYMENNHPEYAPLFFDFYQKIDCMIAEIIQTIPDDMELLLLSDHGFTTLKKEVCINRWLWEKGLLRFTKSNPQTLADMHPESSAYSLYPGRIYINLQGREKNGVVKPGVDYEQTRQRIKQILFELRDPENRQPVVKDVLFSEQLSGQSKQKRQIFSAGNVNGINLSGNSKRLNSTPDMIALGHYGYDLKGNLWRENLFEKTVFNGTHTFDDAFILMRNKLLPDKRLSIAHIASIILSALEVPIPDDMETVC